MQVCIYLFALHKGFFLFMPVLRRNEDIMQGIETLTVLEISPGATHTIAILTRNVDPQYLQICSWIPCRYQFLWIIESIGKSNTAWVL